MEARRVDGIKYHFDRLSDNEVAGLLGHLVERRNNLNQDIDVVSSEMFRRVNEELPLGEDYTTMGEMGILVVGTNIELGTQ